MALRCTVFGHDWGETDVEREREEEGSEVVVSVREVRTCDRCGSEDVLGESMEVTALDQQPAEPATEEPDRTPEQTEPPEQSYEGDRDDGVILDDASEGGDTDDQDPRAWPERPEHERADDEPREPEPWPETARPDEDDRGPEERFVGAEHPSPDTSEGAPAPGQEEPASVEREPAADRETPPFDGDDPTPERGTGAPDRAGGGEIIDASEDDRGPADGDPDGTEVARPDTPDTAPGDVEEGGPGPGAGPEEGTTGREDEDPAGDGTVDIPTAESDPDDPEAAARDPSDSESGLGGREAEAAAEEAQEDTAPGVHDAGTGATAEGTDDGPEEPAAMGPDATQRPEDDAEILDETDTTEQSRVTASEPVDPDEVGGPRDSPPGETGGAADDDRGPSPEHIEFYCPECGFVDDSTWPSRRAGDICPECQRSYLAEREV